MESRVSNSDELYEHFVRHVRAEALFPESGVALAAVSGGPDSSALLELFHRSAEAFGLTLVVAHVDHGIAPERARWEAAARTRADTLGVPFHVRRASLGPEATETAARHARYELLRAVQGEVGARYLVTAHHADDQIETVLFRVLRGSGPAGLAGIPARGPDGLVRPLLPFHKVELTAWLASIDPGVASVTDPANADERHDRSWLRTRALPLLRARFGAGLEENLLDVARQAREDRRAWRAVLGALDELEFTTAADRVEVARPPLARYDKVLSEALLRAAAREVGCHLGARHAARLVAFLTAPSGRVFELGNGWVAETVFDRLVLRRAEMKREAPRAVPWGTTESGAIEFAGWTIAWEPDTAAPEHRHGFSTWVTPGTGVVRALRRGDRLVPAGGVGHRPARRMLMEARVPRESRDRYPILTRDDVILWIPGVCRSAVALPPPGTRATRVDARRSGDS